MSIKKYQLISISILVSISIPGLVFAFSYSRTPVGVSVSGPIIFNVTLTQQEMNTIGTDIEPSAAYWCIQPNDIVTSAELFSEGVPISQLSHTFTMNLQNLPQVDNFPVGYTAVVVFTAPAATCTSDNVFGGGFNVEGDGSEVIFAVSGAVGAAPTLQQAATIAEQPETRQATQVSASVFSRDLSLGMSGDDVKILQAFLAADQAIYPEGLVTGYFGPLTQKAVENFQIKYGIVSGGTPETTGFGRVGPKTRAKLNEIINAR